MPRSIVWKHFEKVDDTSTKCNFCGAVVMTSKNTTNLFQHLKNKHAKEHSELVLEKTESSQKRKHEQPTLLQFKEAMNPYDETSPKKQALDKSLIWMILKDMQPVRIVEDEGFKHFVQTLDPRYSLPSRRKIKQDILPALYEEKKEELMTKLQETTSVAITSDIWTSDQTQSYLSVAVHFLDNDTNLSSSAVLKVVHLTSNHTSDNIADELRAVFQEYSISNKITAIVTDNTSDMMAAVKKLSIRHLPCFAHTLNLIVRAAIAETPGMLELQTKVKQIVEYFHRSVNASDWLRQVQSQQNVSEQKLVNDVETRWNSTLLMFQRFIEVHESVTTSLIQLGKGSLCLSDEELETIKKTGLALAPFLKATEEMSAEKTTTLSKVIPLARSLLTKAKASTFPLAKALERNMLTRKFHLFETFHPLNQATLLDPRFKKIAFKNNTSLEQTKVSILEEISHVNPTVVDEPVPSTSASSSADDLWTDFDADVSASTVHRSPQIEAHLEITRYMEDQNIPRTGNPFAYWKENEHSLKKLANVAKKYLCVPATSVPSERLFSKAGELISARRNRQKPKNVNTFLFLNKACSGPNC